MTQELKNGDKVEWLTSHGKTIGTVIKKLIKTIKIKGHVAAASEENPEYLIKSEKSGKQSAHKPETLKKTKV